MFFSRARTYRFTTKSHTSNTSTTIEGVLLLVAPMLCPAGFWSCQSTGSEQGYDVTLLEAAKNPGGLSGGFRTKTGELSVTALLAKCVCQRNPGPLLDGCSTNGIVLVAIY